MLGIPIPAQQRHGDEGGGGNRQDHGERNLPHPAPGTLVWGSPAHSRAVLHSPIKRMASVDRQGTKSRATDRHSARQNGSAPLPHCETCGVSIARA